METLISKISDESIRRVSAWLHQVLAGLNRMVIGQQELKEALVLALSTGQPVLLEAGPGTGKTHAAKAMAALAAGQDGQKFGRAQGTSDTLPSDLTGSVIWVPAHTTATGEFVEGDFRFIPGPLFRLVVLIDDGSRLNPGAHSGLIEAFEEGQVTVNGKTHHLPKGQIIIMTINPTEHAGTQQVPDAILDRFIVRVSVVDPTAAEAAQIARGQFTPIEDAQPIIGIEQILEIRGVVDAIRSTASDDVTQYALDLVKLRDTTEGGGRVFERSQSLRPMIDILLSAAFYALLDRRNAISRDDVRRAAQLVLVHRLVFTWDYAKNHPDTTVESWLRARLRPAAV